MLMITQQQQQWYETGVTLAWSCKDHTARLLLELRLLADGQ
jgi:hypothetical protein